MLFAPCSSRLFSLRAPRSLRELWPFTVGRTGGLKLNPRTPDHSTHPAAKPRGNCVGKPAPGPCGAAFDARPRGSRHAWTPLRRGRSFRSPRL